MDTKEMGDVSGLKYLESAGEDYCQDQSNRG
jgi:hypothetical protein